MATALPHTAHVLQDASRALEWVGSAGTLARYTEMAEREIIFDRVVGVEAPQRPGDLFGSRPARGAACGQTEVEPNPMNVRVDGNDELRGRNLPQTEIHPVGGPNHPARVEEKAFARAPRARVTDQVAHVSTIRVTTERIGETGQRVPKIAVALSMELRETTTQGSVCAEQAARPCEHLGQVRLAVDAVDEPPQQRAQLPACRAFDRPRRLGTQRVERAFDAPPRGNRVPKGETRGDQAGDFLVARVGVLVNDPDRISFAGRCGVAGSQQRIEPFASSVHFDRVLAILPSQPQ